MIMIANEKATSEDIQELIGTDGRGHRVYDVRKRVEPSKKYPEGTITKDDLADVATGMEMEFLTPRELRKVVKRERWNIKDIADELKVDKSTIRMWMISGGRGYNPRITWDLVEKIKKHLASGYVSKKLFSDTFYFYDWRTPHVANFLGIDDYMKVRRWADRWGELPEVTLRQLKEMAERLPRGYNYNHFRKGRKKPL